MKPPKWYPDTPTLPPALGNTIKRKLKIVAIIFLALFLLSFKIGVSSAEGPNVPHESSDSVLESIRPVPTVRELVLEYANKYNVDVDTAMRVIGCESGFNPSAQNPTSTAGGVMQFVDRTWKSVNKIRGTGWTLADKYDARKNIDNGMWLVHNEGWHHWQCY